VRQLLTESLLLSALGGAVGVCLGVWGTSLLAAIGATEARFVPADIDYGVSWRILLFTLVVTVGTGLLFGLVPAWRASRLDLTSSMKEGSRTVGGVTRSRLSKALVVAQVAMSLVLLVGAGLFVRTVRNLETANAGFDERNLLVFTLQPGSAGYKDDRLLELYRQVAARVEALPGVRSATFSHVPLIANFVNDTLVYLPGENESTEAEHDTNRQIVRENFFDALGIPILRGRGFTAQDAVGTQKVAVVSEAFVRDFMNGVDPIGVRIGFNKETLGQVEIVGVARDIKYSDKRTDYAPLTYTPWLQEVDGIDRVTFAVRTAGDPSGFSSSVRQAVREVDATLPVTDVTTQEAQARRTYATERTLANVLSFFGFVALLLAAIGIYGVMAYSVAQRTNEIGIRMALGADVAGVLRLVVWQGLRFALVGLVLGAAGAFALKRVVESELYGVGATDPVTFVAVATTLLGAALVACLLPARRAARVDPVVALRSE
jgi:predicted permease